MKDGGPAFPCTVYTLRDYFAGQAVLLMGQARGVAIFEAVDGGGARFVKPELIAQEVYRLADAMIAERHKAPQPAPEAPA